MAQTVADVMTRDPATTVLGDPRQGGAAAARPALSWDGPAHAVPGRPGEAAANVAVRLRGEDS